ncbi:MAG: hypothetical protein GY841_16020 [FCB group bacterium]|nr:hypothetical protein [FCB group bacterium]
MKKIVLTLAILSFAVPAFGADYILRIKIPDAWVQRTANAFDGTYHGRVAAGMTKAEWVAYHVRRQMKQIVLQFENDTNLKTWQDQNLLTTDDVPITGAE